MSEKEEEENEHTASSGLDDPPCSPPGTTLHEARHIVADEVKKRGKDYAIITKTGGTSFKLGEYEPDRVTMTYDLLQQIDGELSLIAYRSDHEPDRDELKKLVGKLRNL